MSEYRYKAFISYSHGDEKWARWLHRWLEAYRAPKRIDTNGETRLKPVFRDREELSSSASLSNSIKVALYDSESLIVICSPNAACSKWVNEEIRTFQSLGRGERVFCVIVAGEPATAFPPALQSADEPLAADLKQDGKRNTALKIAAGLLDIRYDALRQREAQARLRRLMAITAASVAGMVFSIGLAWFALFSRQQAIDARIEADRQRIVAEAEAATSRQVTNFLLSTFKQADPEFYEAEEPTAREILTQGALRLRHELNDQPDIKARLLAAIGSALLGISQGDDAIELLSEALVLQETQLGVDHIELVPTLLDLARAESFFAGNGELAGELGKRALVIQQARYGPESIEVASMLADVSLFTRTGESAMLQRAQRIAQTAEPESATHAKILLYLSFHNLAEGRLAQARSNLERTIEIQESLGDLSALIRSLSSLAGVLDHLNEPEAAIRLHERAVRLSDEVRGPGHPWTAAIVNNLAVAHHLQGSLDSAEQHYLRVLDIAESSLGPRSGLRRVVLGNLAELERDRGAFAQANAYFEMAMELDMQNGGEPQAYLLGQLALLRLAEHRFDESLGLFERYFAGVDDRSTVGDPTHVPILEGYARLLRELSQPR